VFNLTRFAREKYDHFALRAHLKSLGISLRSATEPIDDSATGKLMEGVLAAFAQFDNDVRSDRTKAGMQSALAFGRWTFLAPIGYLNAPRQFGASLIPDPERAPLVRRAFEEFATGRFTKREVLANVTRLGLRSRRGAVVSAQTFDSMLENTLYAGIVDVPEYGVREVRGDFEPLIDEATFHKVQAVLSGRISITSPRKRNRPDFPLRGFVRFESCGRPLTASWSKGRSDRYAYYHCLGGKCRGQRYETTARRTVRGGVGAAAADRRLHAAAQGHGATGLARAKGGGSGRGRRRERRVAAIRQKLDQLDDAFLFAKTIDIETLRRSPRTAARRTHTCSD
jgi:site-specific DNA recombinase